MKIDLKDCTFAIPVRIDSNDRMENLQLILMYLTHHFDTNIIVIENDKESKLENLTVLKYNSEINHIFQKLIFQLLPFAGFLHRNQCLC